MIRFRIAPEHITHSRRHLTSRERLTSRDRRKRLTIRNNRAKRAPAFCILDSGFLILDSPSLYALN